MNNIAISTITTKYQITIPKSVREKFKNFNPYSKVKVEFDEKSKSIMITPQKELKDLVGFLKKSNKTFTDEELDNGLQEYRKKKLIKKYGTNSGHKYPSKDNY